MALGGLNSLKQSSTKRGSDGGSSSNISTQTTSLKELGNGLEGSEHLQPPGSNGNTEAEWEKQEMERKSVSTGGKEKLLGNGETWREHLAGQDSQLQ